MVVSHAEGSLQNHKLVHNKAQERDGLLYLLKRDPFRIGNEGGDHENPVRNRDGNFTDCPELADLTFEDCSTDAWILGNLVLCVWIHKPVEQGSHKECHLKTPSSIGHSEANDG